MAPQVVGEGKPQGEAPVVGYPRLVRKRLQELAFAEWSQRIDPAGALAGFAGARFPPGEPTTKCPECGQFSRKGPGCWDWEFLRRLVARDRPRALEPRKSWIERTEGNSRSPQESGKTLSQFVAVAGLTVQRPEHGKIQCRSGGAPVVSIRCVVAIYRHDSFNLPGQKSQCSLRPGEITWHGDLGAETASRARSGW